MSTTATLESRLPAMGELAPLELGFPEAEKPDFIGHVFHAAADWWVNNACGPGVVHRADKPLDFGKSGQEKISLNELLSTRIEHIS